MVKELMERIENMPNFQNNLWELRFKLDDKETIQEAINEVRRIVEDMVDEAREILDIIQ